MRSWREIEDELKDLLAKLNSTGKLKRDEINKIPEQGVYVFYENGRPMYVGRSNRLKARILEHGRPSSFHNSAPFAFNIAKEQAGKLGISIDRARSSLENAPRFRREFTRAKERVAKMEVRAIAISDQVVQTVFEIYAVLQLGTTKYNFFDTH